MASMAVDLDDSQGTDGGSVTKWIFSPRIEAISGRLCGKISGIQVALLLSVIDLLEMRFFPG